MKKYIGILFLCLLLVPFVHAQARLGSSPEAIKQEFSDSKYELDSGYDEDDIYYISLQIGLRSVQHLFGEDNICQVSIITPNTQEELNSMIEEYNKLYVIDSENKWKVQSSEGTTYVKLVSIEDGPKYFLWSLDEINWLWY
ncbi:MAG: hypothetical protein PHQ33_04685 [Bacteroidales bacterium]|jgi:hypothetical protein|nr:hypothetical protein [Bacteroidales bacterium]MDD4395163.1 hypothetical protein [Bacteroidales bacterium]